MNLLGAPLENTEEWVSDTEPELITEVYIYKKGESPQRLYEAKVWQNDTLIGSFEAYSRAKLEQGLSLIWNEYLDDNAV
jgi:hypothetical protein